MSTLSEAARTVSASKTRRLGAQWLRGLAMGVGLQGVHLFLALGTGVTAARLLGPAGFGQYAYALAIAGVASVVAALGLPATVTRYLSVYRLREEWALARGLLRYSGRATGIAGSLLALGVAYVGAFAWQGERFALFLVTAPLVLLVAWINLTQKALQGLEHPILAQLPAQVIKYSAFLVLAGGLWLTGGGRTLRAQDVMIVWLISVILALLTGAGLVYQSSPTPLRDAVPRYVSGGWLRVALPLLLADGVGIVYTLTDILLLGILRPDAEVGFYQAAVRTSGIMVMALGASNWVLAPWFARLHDQSKIERLQRVVTRTTRAVFGITLSIFLVLLLWGKALLVIFFGSAYAAAFPVLFVLAAARLVDVAAGPVVNMLAMTGGQATLARTVAAAAMANIAGCLLLIPRIGMLGAAVSSAVAIAGTNLILSRTVHVRTGVATTVLGRWGG